MNGVRKYQKNKSYQRRTYTNRYNTRYYRSIKNNDTTSVKCELNSGLSIVNTAQHTTFDTGAASYLTISTILNNSVSFQDMTGRYARYKITGIALRFDSVVLERPSTLPQLPIISCAFYPQTSGSHLADSPMSNDKRAIFNPVVSTSQTKYWRFPENYFSSSNGGYGTWNNMTSYASLPGQISIYNPNLTANATADTRFANLCVTVYTIFSNKNI